MKVTILQCSNPNFWYADSVGSVVEIKMPLKDDRVFHEATGRGAIQMHDASIVHEEKSVYVINWDNVHTVEHLSKIIQSFGITIPENNPMFDELEGIGLLTELKE